MRQLPARPPLSRRIEIVIACLLIPPALEMFSAARVLGVLERIRPRRRIGRISPAAIARYVDALLTRLPGPWRHTCLRRAAVLAGLLRREGMRAEVVIGVKKGTTGAVEAHAWIRCNGIEPYLDQTPTTGFVPLNQGLPLAWPPLY